MRRQTRGSSICSRRPIRVELSTFTLDDEALVTRSLQLDEVPRARLSTVTRRHRNRASATRRWWLRDVQPSRGGAAGEWLRCGPGDRPRTPRSSTARSAPATRTWSVSALETYLGCPFKFFAQHVLRLEEEPDDEEVMDPRRQGQFVHDVFEAFFDDGRPPGTGRSRRADSDEARALFTAVVDRALERLPEAEAGLERTRLLGSSAAAGLGEAVFRMEAERPIAGRRAAARAPARRRIFTIDTDAGSARRRASRQGRSARSARRRHVPADRLQARLAARSRARPAAADLRLCAEQRLTAARPATGRSAKRCISRSRGRSGSCRCSRPRQRATSAGRGAAAARRHASTPSSAASSRRRRTMSSAARPAASRGVPEGLCRRRLSVCRSTTGRRSGFSRICAARCEPRAATPSILAKRRARGVGRHRQDARPRRALRQPAARRRRAGSHPGDHVHAQGGRRDARAHHRAAARGQPAVRSSTSRAGAISRIGSATSPSPPSTPSACRCCASFRSKPTSIRASISPTRPRCRGWSASRSTRRSASAAAIARRRRRRRAGLRAARRAAASRRVSRRCSTGGSSRRRRCAGTWRRARAI